MIVLNHHGEPTPKELEHMKIISKKLFPDKRWRGIRRQLKDHFHEHFVDKERFLSEGDIFDPELSRDEVEKEAKKIIDRGIIP